MLQATGAGLAGAGLSWVSGTASAAGINTPPLVRDGNQIVDPQGDQVILNGVSIADPGEQARCWRGMDSKMVVDMATSHSDWSNTLIRVPMMASFIFSGDAGLPAIPGSDECVGDQTPAPGDLPHNDDWGPALPGTYGADKLEQYCDAYITDIVEKCQENGAYVMLDYHRHYPVFHHEQHTHYVEGNIEFDNKYDVNVEDVWKCSSTESAPHTAVGDGPSQDFDVRPNKGQNGNTCGERGLLWHGMDQKEEIRDLVDEQQPWEYFDGADEPTSDADYSFEGPDDVYLEPDPVCHALDAEMKQFWNVVAEKYAEYDNVIFDIYNEPTGPYAGDWGGPERPAGALSLPPETENDDFELWGKYAKPYYDLWRDRSQPWVEAAEDNGQGQVMTIGNPRWSQYVYWAPYNEHDAENMAYTNHVYLQDNCRPLEKYSGEPAKQVPVFFSEFGWMDFDLTVPTPWMTLDQPGINWWEGETDPEDGYTYQKFIEEFDVHPVCWAFDHTYEPIFFEHGEPGTTEGAKGSSHWYDDGYLIDEETPGGVWQEFVNDRAENDDRFNPASGSSPASGTDLGPSSLDATCDGYASDVLANVNSDYVEGECGNGGTPPEDCENGETVGDKCVTDPDSDGYYEDFNGDGEMTHADVQEFFSVQHRPTWKQPGMFDFNGNEAVGHGDVVALFEDVATSGV